MVFSDNVTEVTMCRTKKHTNIKEGKKKEGENKTEIVENIKVEISEKNTEKTDNDILYSLNERMDVLYEYILLMIEEEKAAKNKNKNDFMDYLLPIKNMT